MQDEQEKLSYVEVECMKIFGRYISDKTSKSQLMIDLSNKAEECKKATDLGGYDAVKQIIEYILELWASEKHQF